jgi:hypothetical protein
VPPWLEVVPLACLLCWYTNPNLFGLLASGHFSTQALCGEARPDFLSGPSISIPLAILMIPTMSSRSFGNWTRHPPPTLATSPKKMLHLRCNIHWGVEIEHIGLKGPRVPYLNQVHSLDDTPMWAESGHLENGERRGNKNSNFDIPKIDNFKNRLEYTQNILFPIDLFPWRVKALNLEWSH